jgi:hypothetical protein
MRRALGLLWGVAWPGRTVGLFFQAGFKGLFVYEVPQHLAAAICLGGSSAGPARPGADVL